MGVSAINPGTLPDEVRAGLDRLFADGVYFAPVRHHSPACAYALQAMIRELRPAAVLIEGPDTFGKLIPLLLDDKTKPPVAVLCQIQPHAAKRTKEEDADSAEEEPRSGTAFFPFCDYSPEWVALHEGAALGAQLAFIDRPWNSARQRADDASTEAQSLMAERYLAHSAYLNALAARTGCRDHDELWDHLFELRSVTEMANWRELFSDVFSYCAMARADYEPEVLEAEGSLPRERHMAAHIAQWRRQLDGPIVVVTGGFHTLALTGLWREQNPAPAKGKGTKRNSLSGASDGDGNSWLIRYSFDQLDALNGYGAGMPSPAYYQWVWEKLQAGMSEGQQGQQGLQAQLRERQDHLLQVTIDCLTSFAQQSRARGLVDQISSANVQSAVIQAVRLAELRGHAGPGRQDLLDAVRSCFIKGAIHDGTQGLTSDLRRLLGGSRIGNIPPSAGSPPLLEDARRMASRNGVRLDDSEPRTSHLDLYRKPSHRERSRFFHLMTYLDTGLAKCQSGPDFLGNSRLDLMIEEWRNAWTPLVEARLIELSSEGATLADVALARLRREETLLADRGHARSANHAVGLLIRACLIGLHERLPSLIRLLSAHLEEDANFGSVVDCGHRLATLWRAREPLGVQQHPELLGLMQKVWPSALFLLPDLARVKAEAEAEAVQHLLSLREFGRALHGILADGDGSAAGQGLLHAQLVRLLAVPDASAGISGAAAAMLFLDGQWSARQLVGLLTQRFGTGAEAAQSVRFLSGLMAAAPELLLCQPELRAGINRVVANWDEQTFVMHLPDLRHAFTGLKPQETNDLAEALNALNGASESVAIDLAQTHYQATEEDLLQGSALHLALRESLQRDALIGWVQTNAEESNAG
ncbi:DUF5682 family protein [Noviherbaspirillum agri]